MPASNTTSSNVLQPLTTEQTGIYLQGQRLATFVSDYIVEIAPEDVRRQYGVEVQLNTTRGAPKETRRLRPNQYIPLVRNLVDRGALEVPRHILQALKSLIRTRKMVCLWFQDAKDPQTIGDNERHQYFIKVLDRVEQMLSPYEAASSARQIQLKVVEEEVQAITNVFANLEMFQTDDNNNLATDQNVNDVQAKAESAVDIFPAESNSQTRKNYKRICEVNWTLHQCCLIRGHILQKWRDHREGRCDLSVVTLLTKTAVEMV